MAAKAKAGAGVKDPSAGYKTQDEIAGDVRDIIGKVCQVRRDLAAIGAAGNPLTTGSGRDHNGDADIRRALKEDLLEPPLKAALTEFAHLHCNHVVARAGHVVEALS